MALTSSNDAGLLGSYVRAFEAMGLSVMCWDLEDAVREHTRFGRIGHRAASFVPVEPWLTKANRALVVAARDLTPDVLITACNAPVRAGALAQIRTSMPGTQLVLLWPDPLVNLSHHGIAGLPLYDLVATYSQASVSTFERLGVRAVEWVPFGADPVLFPAEIEPTSAERRRYGCDVTFIGNHRPERERDIVSLMKAGFHVKVWGGSSWARDVADRKRAKQYWQGRPLVGRELATAVRCASVTLNRMDDTNYPAANMRFFENLACRGVSLSSPCPELESVFLDRESMLYYHDTASLLSAARELVDDPALREKLAARGYEQVMAEHRYEHRARQILSVLGQAI